MGDWSWVCNSASTIRQGVKANTDAKVLKVKLALNWTGLTKSYQLVPAPLLTSRTARRSAITSSIWISLPTCPVRMLVGVWRSNAYKPCANPHDSSEMPKYPPAGLTQYVFYKISKKSRPYPVSYTHLTLPTIYSV